MADANQVKRERATMKRLFTRAKQALQKAIEEEDGLDVVANRMEDLNVRWKNVQEKHEDYLSMTLDEDGLPSAEQENWISELEAGFKKMEIKGFEYKRRLCESDEKERGTAAIERSSKLQEERFKNLLKLEEATVLSVIKNIEKLLAEEKPAVDTVEEVRKEVKENFDRYKSAQGSYINLASEWEVDEEIKKMEEIHQSYSQISKKIGIFIESESKQEKKVVVKAAPLRLERLRMPTFAGEIRDYPRFKSDFLKQVMPEIPDNDAAAYALRSCLQGSPLNLVSNVDDDLKEMWLRLDERYGDPARLVDVIMNDIKRLRTICEGDDEKFLDLVNIVERGYRDLARVKMEREISNTTTVSAIEEKLPKSIRRQWSIFVNEPDSKVDKCNKFPSLLKFMLAQKSGIEYESSMVRNGSVNNFDTNAEGNKWEHKTEHKTEHKKEHKTEHKTEKTEEWEGRQCVKFAGCWLHNQDPHKVGECRAFLAKTPEERMRLVKDNDACWSCLQQGHQSANCPHRKRCEVDKCGRYHHNTLHEAHAKGLQFHSQNCTTNTSCLLQLMAIKSGTPRPLMLNTMWDGGATLSLITFSKARELGLPGKRIRLSVVKVGGQLEEIDSYQYDLPLCDRDGDIVNFIVYGIRRISSTVSAVDDREVIKLFSDVKVEEVMRPEGEVDLLIGFEYAGFHPVRVHSIGHLLLLENRFGKCIGGCHSMLKENTQKLVKSAIVKHMGAVTIKDFYEIEAMGVGGSSCKCRTLEGSQHTLKEARELAMIENGLTHCGTHWVAKMPWIRDPNLLPNNRKSAYGMLKSLEQRLLRNPAHASLYQNQIEDMIDRGVARKLTKEEIINYDGPVFYVGHHDVLKPDSESTPCRIVFNSSAKVGKHILNEYWAKGPIVMNNLLGVLIRYREERIAVSGDIKKMYHAIKISTTDQHTHRFLWRDLRTDDEADEYVITSVCFGDKPSGTIAAVALQKTARMGADKYPEAAKIIERDTYVDDIITSFNETDEAVKLTKDIENVISPGGFRIKGWTMSRRVENNGCRVNETKHIGGTDSSETTSKVLGMVWNPQEDQLGFEVKLNFSKRIRKMRTGPDLTLVELPEAIPDELTKRMILSQVNGIYDPLGLVTPFTVKAKIMMRKLCCVETRSLGWDDAIPTELREEWVCFFKELFSMSEWKFERSLKPENAVGAPTLIIFSDASELAFGACAYVRWQLTDGVYCSRLIVSKSRIAPLKKITIVRLELCGAVLAVRLKVFIEGETRYNFNRCYLIIDSEIVRGMVQKESYGFNTFAGVRIGEIQRSSNPADWFWVEGKLNVADWITRGKAPREIGTGSVWQNGPDFLKLDEADWPIQRESHNAEVLPELVKQVMTVAGKTEVGISHIIDMKRYSDYEKLIRITARVVSVFTGGDKPSLKNVAEIPTVDEYDAAELRWIKEVQVPLHQQMQHGKFIQLSPRLRNDGVITVGGRVEKWMGMTYNLTQPVLLPYSSRFPKLYATSIHNDGHLGLAASASKVRLKYWIPRLMKNSVDKSWAHCGLTD